ncbi:MAG: endonuclease, partial [Marmoricola sp.]|nr:endonuclease [Marmoricola sp.]
ENLADLCQHHHNLKTHTTWTYTQLEPGMFLWRSPHGYTYLRDRIGTSDLTPPPLDPPGG